MTKHLLIASLIVASAATGGPAQDKKKAEGPGPEHAALAKLAGEYTTVSAFRIPGQPAQESKGAAKLTSIVGGRFLDEESTGELMGQKTTSRHMYGYNAEAKKYEGTWIYSGSTAMMNLSGRSPDSGKTIEMTGTSDQADGAKMTFGITLKRIDDNSFTVELSAKAPDGRVGPTLTTTYTRKK